jgi:hypothetical protein
MTTNYNATVYETTASGHIGTFVAHVENINGRPQMTRSNAVQCTGYEDQISRLKVDVDGFGKAGEEVATYDFYMRRRNPDSTFQIVIDNCDGYRNALSGTNLPPAYK